MLASPDFHHYGFVSGMCFPQDVWRRLHDVKVICNIFISAPAYGIEMVQRVLYGFLFCMYGSPYFHLYFHHLCSWDVFIWFFTPCQAECRELSFVSLLRSCTCLEASSGFHSAPLTGKWQLIMHSPSDRLLWHSVKWAVRICSCFLVARSSLDRLDLRCMSPSIHWFAEPGEVPGS